MFAFVLALLVPDAFVDLARFTDAMQPWLGAASNLRLRSRLLSTVAVVVIIAVVRVFFVS